MILSAFCLAQIVAWAQPAKVLRETVVRRSAGGEAVGSVGAGTDLQVLSRVTTETGTWCRVSGSASGSVACRDLAIRQPEPPRVVVAQPVTPPAARSAAKPRKPKTAHPDELLVAPTAAEMKKILPGMGTVTTALAEDPSSPVILQEYKFSDNSDLSVVLWVRPQGQSLSAPNDQIARALTETMTKIQTEVTADGRRMRVGKTSEGVMATGLGPGGEYEWTFLYGASGAMDDLKDQVAGAARAVDRLLFLQ